MLVVWGLKQQRKKANWGKCWMKINMCRIHLKQCKITSRKQILWKLTWMLKMLVVLGLQQERKRAKSGQNLHQNKCVQNSTKSKEKVELPKEIIKINLDVANAGGFRLKKTMKKYKQGAQFTWKLMCPEFNQMNRKGQLINREYENYLGCWTWWWLGGEKNKERGQTGGKVWLKLNVSRNSPNQMNGARWQKRFWKINWMLKIFMVWWSKQQRKRSNWGQNLNNKYLSRIRPNQWKITSRR